MDPKDLLNNPDQIKSLISLLQAMLPNEEKQEQEPTKTKSKNKKEAQESTEPSFNSKIKTKNKRSAQPSSANKFEKMAEFNMHKDDRAIDEKLAKHPPVARTREFEPIIVKCRVCGKEEAVNPSLVHDSPSRYKCNNCSTQAG